jgi:hypothetical protein
MSLDQIIVHFQSLSILYLFLKAFAILFSLLYLAYSLVLLKQTQIMNNTLTVGRSSLITVITFVQLVIGLILVLLAIFVF